MEIEDSHVLELMEQLVAGQARNEQKLIDINNNVEKGFHFISTKHEDLDKRVTSIEKKQWYMSGASATFGAAIGFITSYLHK